MLLAPYGGLEAELWTGAQGPGEMASGLLTGSRPQEGGPAWEGEPPSLGQGSVPSQKEAPACANTKPLCYLQLFSGCCPPEICSNDQCTFN